MTGDMQEAAAAFLQRRQARFRESTGSAAVDRLTLDTPPATRSDPAACAGLATLRRLMRGPHDLADAAQRGGRSR